MQSNKKTDTKLLGLIKKLAPKDHRDLQYFMEMPSNRLTKRHKEILTQLLKLGKKGLIREEEEVLLPILSPSERQNKNKIKNRLLKVLEKYICHLEANADKKIKNLLLAQYYLQHQIDKNLNAILKQEIKKLAIPSIVLFQLFYFLFKNGV